MAVFICLFFETIRAGLLDILHNDVKIHASSHAEKFRSVSSHGICVKLCPLVADVLCISIIDYSYLIKKMDEFCLSLSELFLLSGPWPIIGPTLIDTSFDENIDWQQIIENTE